MICERQALGGEKWSVVLAEITTALAKGETVKLASFGTFSTRQKRGRIGRNPKTGEVVPISPRTVVVFRPPQVLKGRIGMGWHKRSCPGSGSRSSLPRGRRHGAGAFAADDIPAAGARLYDRRTSRPEPDVQGELSRESSDLLPL